ncbi:MAG: GNAT family N-acetyltransferase [Cyclobacteriaceae bacterium]
MVTKVKIRTEDIIDKSFRFLINPSWYQFTVTFETHLYQQPEYMALFSDSERISFGIARSDQPELLAFISFQLNSGRACSGVGKPFGSLDFSQYINEDVLYRFLLFVEQQLKAIGLQYVEMRLPALAYQPSKVGVWQKVLADRSYRQLEFAVNHHLQVNATPFEQGIHTMEQRRLMKCKKMRFQVEKADSEDLSEIYHFIKACREERGQSLSLSWEEMRTAALAFPQAYLLFKTTLNGALVAAAIVVRVNQRILYNFYPASGLRYQSYSPQVILLEYIYQYAQKHHYEILDLGTSMVAGEPKASLINYKERVGGISTAKLCFDKSLI